MEMLPHVSEAFLSLTANDHHIRAPDRLIVTKEFGDNLWTLAMTDRHGIRTFHAFPASAFAYAVHYDAASRKAARAGLEAEVERRYREPYVMAARGEIFDVPEKHSALARVYHDELLRRSEQMGWYDTRTLTTALEATLESYGNDDGLRA